MVLKRTTKISMIAAAILAGIWLGLHGATVWWPLAGLVVAVAVALRQRSRWLLMVLVGLGLIVGIWRGHDARLVKERLQSLVGQKVSVLATVGDDPATAKAMSFNLASAQLADGRPLAGRISVYTYPVRLQRGYRLQLTGKVKPGFGAADIELSYPKITLLSTDQGWLERLRQRFFAGMATALPEPLASFGIGLLVGARALIPKDLQAQLAVVGLSHLVAVSGYNLTIIVGAVERLLGRLSRNLTLVGTAWLITGFVVVSGGSASIVRAALVSALALAAASRGRHFQPLNLILGTATLTALWSPAYFRDLGWLLSYLAFFGILVLAPAVQARLGWRRRAVTSLVIESLAAQIMTVPLVMLIFHQLSLVAPLSNLLILPLVPVAMFVCLIAGLAGMLIPVLAGWLAWPAVLLLGLMLAVVHTFAGWHWASLSQGMDLPIAIICYALVAVVAWIIAYKSQVSVLPGESSDLV